MADTKLSALTEDESISGTELLYVVDDPSGTPTSKKVVLDDLKTFVTPDLSGYAEKTNVLELDNTTEFTPDADYEPATKKYVDDNAGGGNLFFTFQKEEVTPNGTYPLFTSPVAGTIVKYYWTSDILPVGSARTRDIRKNGTATTDSINTSDTPLSIATNQSATNGKYTVSTDVIDNGAVVAGTVLYDVFAGGSTSGTANDCITIEIEPS